MTDPDVGIVLPTKGFRVLYLKESIESIRNAGNCHILLIAPDPSPIFRFGINDLVDQIEVDNGSSLAEAIDAGISALPQTVKFVNWLGDDDRLSPNSITLTSRFLRSNPTVDCVFGQCSYIDRDGRAFLHNKSGSWATWFMKYGPCLIPQPGALFRRSSYEKVGGLNQTFDYAFDLDLWLKFSSLGKMHYLDAHLGDFRWHSDSKTVSNRIASIRESRRVRAFHLSRLKRQISPVWEIPFTFFSNFAGQWISKKSSI